MGNVPPPPPPSPFFQERHMKKFNQRFFLSVSMEHINGAEFFKKNGSWQQNLIVISVTHLVLEVIVLRQQLFA